MIEPRIDWASDDQAAHAEALDRAGGQQLGHVLHGAGRERAEQEDHDRHLDEDLLVVEVGELAPDRAGHGHREQRGGDHPGVLRLGAVQVGDDRRQRGGDDRRADDRHEERRHQADEDLDDLLVGHLGRGGPGRGLRHVWSLLCGAMVVCGVCDSVASDQGSWSRAARSSTTVAAWAMSSRSQWSSRSASTAHMAVRARSRRARPGVGDADQLGAAVGGIGPRVDQPQPVEAGELTADDRRVDAEGAAIWPGRMLPRRDEHAEGDDVAAAQVADGVAPVGQRARSERLKRTRTSKSPWTASVRSTLDCMALRGGTHAWDDRRSSPLVVRKTN